MMEKKQRLWKTIRGKISIRNKTWKQIRDLLAFVCDLFPDILNANWYLYPTCPIEINMHCI